jgi:hypothetical protein
LKILITGNMGYVGTCVVERMRFSYPDALLSGLDTGYFANCITGVMGRPVSTVDVHYADVKYLAVLQWTPSPGCDSMIPWGNI